MTQALETELKTAIKDLGEARGEFTEQIKELGEGAGLQSEALKKLEAKLTETVEKATAIEEKMSEDLCSVKELQELRDAFEELEVKSQRPHVVDDHGKLLVDPDTGIALKELPDYGFKSAIDFIYELKSNPGSQKIREAHDGEMQRKQIDVANQPGVLLPTRFLREIGMQDDPFGAIMRSRATVIPAGSPPDGQVDIPALQQNQGDGTAWDGGVTVTWISEGATKPETDADFREISLTPEEVAAHLIITDKMLRNNSAVRPIVEKLFRQAIAYAEDAAFIGGNGTGKPLGFQGHAAQLDITRNAGGNQLEYEDFVNLLQAMVPGTSPIWVLQHQLLSQAVLMEGPSGNPSFVWHDNAVVGLPGRILGFPVIFSDRVAAAGAVGDVNLIDPSQYLIKDGSGPFIDASPHPHFTTNRTILKVFWNVDGAPWCNAAYTTRDGSSEVSPFCRLTVHV